MSQLPRPNQGTILTAEEERLWSNAIGGVFLNFGGIELASLRWIEVLSTDLILRDVAIDMNLSQRIGLIKRLVERASWPPGKKKKAVELWAEVAKRSETRNAIAHNPFSFCRDREGRPTAGIINFKRMKGPGPYEIPLLNAEQILDTAFRAGELSKELHALWAEPYEEPKLG
jgi:hypothetical protein